MQRVLRRNRMFSYLLLLAFMLTTVLFPLPAHSQGTLKDIQGHWTQETIQKMADAGNPDGTFNPDGKITRAQFATLLVKAYDLTGNGKVYQDTANHWTKDYIAIASANGIVNGYSTNKFGPDDQITREQLAVMIVKAARLDLSIVTSDLTDQSQISSWASAAVATAYANGIIKGLPNGRFAPKGNATRAQAAVVINASLNIKAENPAPRPITEQDYSLIGKAGTYGPVSGTKTIEGNVTVKAKDTILQNLIIKGDLIIAKEVGSGDVTLDNITVEGKTYIRGGGKDSIHINGGKYNEIIIEETVTGSVRIVALDTQGIRVNIAENAKGDEIILEGDIKTIVVKADDVKISTQGDTNIAEFKVQSGLKDVQIELAKGSSVQEMVLDSKVSVTGEGTIREASGTKVSDAAFTTKPDSIIKPSTGGGGGSTGSSTIAVNTVTVTGEGGASTITTANGTLQMTAAGTPANASKKNVTWSVINGTGSATITTTGLLTAVSNGTVTVKATAKDGSGKFGEKEIIISGQQGAIISTTSTISNGTVNPVVVVTLANDTFKADGVSTLPANWSGSVGTTGLTGGTITRNSDTQITFYLNGTAKTGTLTLQAKAEALTGGLASNTLTLIVPAAPVSLESISRDFDEMMAGVSKWLPIYMTGSIEPYYYPKTRDGIFKRTLFIAPDTVAVISTSIGNRTANKANFLYKDGKVIEALTDEYNDYLSLCRPLMRIFSNDMQGYLKILSELEKEEAASIVMMESLSIMTMPAYLADEMTLHLGTDVKNKLMRYHQILSQNFEENLLKNKFYEIIKIPDLKTIRNGEVRMSFSEMLDNTYLFYSQEQFRVHLEHIIWLLKSFENYNVHIANNEGIDAYKLYVKEDLGVLVARTSLPSIILAINESHMTAAFWDYLSNKIFGVGNSKVNRKQTISKLEDIIAELS